MADKISTLILTVDLECCRCYKKIRKVIAKCPEIQSQIFDEKKNQVSISGHFDPEKLKRKLYCKACKYIKDIQIQLPVKPPPTGKPVDQKPETKPPKKEPAKQPQPQPEPVLPVPGIPVGPYAPMVCCRPCYEGYPKHGICKFGCERGTCNCKFGCERGCERGTCNCKFGCERGTCNCKFGYERGTCHCKFFSEEDPSCSIM